MDNPYSPPIEHRGEEHSQSALGLWRDRNHLVVQLTDHQFPNRCLKSAEPCATRTSICLDYVPLKTLWVMAAGVVGYRLGKRLFGHSFTLNVPISRDIQSISGLMQRKAAKAVGYSMISLFIGIGMYFLTSAAGASETVTTAVVLLPIVVVVVLMGIAGIFFTIRQNSLVGVSKFDTTYAWISGVHESYLANLPTWKP